MSLRHVVSSRRTVSDRRKRAALKFVPAIQDLEERQLLSGTPPVAGDGGTNTLHDHAVSGYLYAYDMDGDQTTVSQVSGPSNGTLTLDSNGSFTYTPNQSYVGQDSFTFNASDQDGTSNTATETIDVTNQTPVAGDGGTRTLHDHAVSGYLYAYDMDGDQTTVSQVSGPSNGTLTLDSYGSFTYTPNQGYVGQDSFTFKANDGITDSTTATETIDVSNQAPVAGDQNIDTPQDENYYGSVYAYDMDGDQVTVSIVNQVSHGTLTLDSNGSYEYTPDPGYFGSDSFTFKANDGITDSTIATVAFNVMFAPSVTLAVTDASTTYTLMDDTHFKITTATPTAGGSYKVQMMGTGNPNWVDVGQGKTPSVTERVAGTFQARAVLTVAGQQPAYSNSINVTVQFPTAAAISADATVKAAEDAAWANTLNYAKTNAGTPDPDGHYVNALRAEYGFWIYLDTTTGKYSTLGYGRTNSGVGPSNTNAQGAGISPGEPPADNPANPVLGTGGVYVVAGFHTHTPETYRWAVGTFNTRRVVGVSSGDNNYISQFAPDYVQIVYDYVGVVDPTDNKSIIRPGDPLNGPAKLYYGGPDRRTTPQ